SLGWTRTHRSDPKISAVMGPTPRAETALN
ncbi:MAG: hypothetical protein ACI8PQ_001060, partial [Planctomycetota bacterium]